MRRKRGLSVLIIVLLLFTMFPLTVLSKEQTDRKIERGEYDTKDEVIYGNLDVNGKTKHLYVVNTFHMTKPGMIDDYGAYTDIRNLTDLTDIKQTEDEKIQFHSDEGEFYYQGELQHQSLPWNISINYLLDGKKVEAEDLAGQSGFLEIQIATSANKKVNPLFFENYLMQISLTLDPSICNNIQAPEGTEANVGKDKQITFTVMPEQEEEFIITTHVTNFEMDPINISALPANLAIDDPDLGTMTGDMQSLSDAIKDVNDGVYELNKGITDLNAGASELSKGSKDYRNGLNKLDQSSQQLVDGSKEIRDILQMVNGSMHENMDVPDISEMKALPKGLRKIASGLKETANGLDMLQENYGKVYNQLDRVMLQIPEGSISEEQIQALYESDADAQVVDQLVKTYIAAQTAKKTYLAVKDGVDAVSETLKHLSHPIYEMEKQLKTMSDAIDQAMKNTEQLTLLEELQNGLSTLATEYQAFHDGLVRYTGGVSTLTTSYHKLDDGIQQLSDGVSTLSKGTGELYNGTKALQESTADLPGQMESEIKQQLEAYDFSDFEPVSFMSDKNKNIGVVQFVLQTERIEIEEVESVEEKETEEKGFWAKLLDLFK